MQTNTRILVITIILALLCLACGSDEASPPCNASVAECNVGGAATGETEEVVLMESWVSQRFMEEKRRISYEALKRNQPACGGGGRGESYSGSCLPPPSNPYDRGCAKYYRCRHDS